MPGENQWGFARYRPNSLLSERQRPNIRPPNLLIKGNKGILSINMAVTVSGTRAPGAQLLFLGLLP